MSIPIFHVLNFTGIFLGYSLLQLSQYMIKISLWAIQKMKDAMRKMIMGEPTLQESNLETGNNKLTLLEGVTHD